MMRLLAIFLLGASAAWAGEAHATSEAPAAEGAIFKEGQGIILGAPTRDAIGLTLVDVAEGDVAAVVRMTAQIYREAGETPQYTDDRPGYAYASAIVAGDAANSLRVDLPAAIEELSVTGRVAAVVRTMQAATGQCEALIEVPDPDAQLAIGDFVQARLLAVAVAASSRVPRTAILEAAGGTFAYVLNGTALLRTAVTTGARDADHVEIVDGLYAGDVVAATAVETLYLIELRATKGGGHCH